jgi:hypothetical protein
MRLTSKFSIMAVVILAAFWFSAENANEMVLIDFVLFRLRVSLPLLVFGNLLMGMGVSLLVGWRADQRAVRRSEEVERSLLQDRRDRFDPGMPEFEPQERDPAEWH